MNQRRFAALLFLGAVSLAGCGGTCEVSGVVKYKGTPLAGGSIAFWDAGKHSWSGTINPDGTYSVPKVPPGNFKVAVTPLVAVILPGEGKAAHKPMTIPSKYNDPEKSNLTVDIRSSKQTYDLDLTD
jgi:hypothetical protein